MERETKLIKQLIDSATNSHRTLADLNQRKVKVNSLQDCELVHINIGGTVIQVDKEYALTLIDSAINNEREYVQIWKNRLERALAVLQGKE